MSVQRYLTSTGQVRYRARIKSGGREIARKTFVRRADAVAWEQEQARHLRHSDWHDPRRGRVRLALVADDWLSSRSSMKRRTLETDRGIWRRYIAPRFAGRQVASITTSEIAAWVGSLIDDGLSRSTATRALATVRSLFAYAVDDRRIARNPAASVRRPTGGRSRREGLTLTADELFRLKDACHGRYGDLVVVLGMEGIRWGELAGLQVGDRITKPGPGLRLRRSVLSSGGGGQQYVDTLKNSGTRTVPLVDAVIPIIDEWSRGKKADDWIFAAPKGGPLHEGNWQRAIRWRDATTAIGHPRLRVHDLRHTAASLWLGAGADPKVVQRILGHASAAMTMDLYGHLIDRNLWDAAKQLPTSGGISGALPADPEPPDTDSESDN